MSYTIEYVRYGITISGPIPIGDIVFITQLGEKKGFDMCDALISDHLPGVTMAMTSESLGDKWRRDLGLTEGSILESLGESGHDVLYDEWDESFLRTVASKSNAHLRQTFEVLDIVRDWQVGADKEVTRLGQWNLKLRAALEKAQWGFNDSGCAECGGYSDSGGHEEGCSIGQALQGEPR